MIVTPSDLGLESAVHPRPSFVIGSTPIIHLKEAITEALKSGNYTMGHAPLLLSRNRLVDCRALLFEIDIPYKITTHSPFGIANTYAQIGGWLDCKIEWQYAYHAGHVYSVTMWY